MRPIQEIAGKLGIDEEHLDLYGKYKAKLSLDLIRDQDPRGKIILLTAMTPTPAGEGKTTTAIGLADGLNNIGKKAVVVLREPSLGPCFGMKGGATGSGKSQVVPMEDINLHFTGDFKAVETATNLLASLIDNEIRLAEGRDLHLDPRTVTWKRAMDMNDRALRYMITGLGGKTGGIPRETGFNITAASEVMAILCLASGRMDLKEKLGRIYVGDTFDKRAIHARDIYANGALAVILKEAIKPNLVQTLEGTPAIIHGGPFANIAQGTNSILATRMGRSLSDYVVTEAGFGADLGAEKFINIKCGYGGFSPSAVAIVATARALKYHGGVSLKELNLANAHAIQKGFCNLQKHLENIDQFQLPAVVVINRFASDTEEEIQTIEKLCKDYGVPAAVNEAWTHGGQGASALAALVADRADSFQGRCRPTYDWNLSVSEKIETVAKNIYGAGAIMLTPKAAACIANIKRLGLEHLPICIAKTQYSLSDNPTKRGRPEGFELAVNDIEIAAGAGFLIPITGDILRMPGLPAKPAALKMDIDEAGTITGLI